MTKLLLFTATSALVSVLLTEMVLTLYPVSGWATTLTVWPEVAVCTSLPFTVRVNVPWAALFTFRALVVVVSGVGVGVVEGVVLGVVPGVVLGVTAEPTTGR